MKQLLPITLSIALLSAISCSGGASHGDNAEPMDIGDFDLDTDSVSLYDNPLAELPEPTIPMPFKRMGNYAKVFNDSNYIHWKEAERIGLSPLTDTRSHWNLNVPLEKIASCKDFYVEPLTYSRPYLIPQAAAMLHEIGRRFNDSIAARGGGDYRIKVTSVLRTPESVARLKRRNRGRFVRPSACHDVRHLLFAVCMFQRPQTPCHGRPQRRSCRGSAGYARRGQMLDQV